MQITSDGSVFGKPDPALVAEIHEKQTLFNTRMINFRVRNSRAEVAIHFRTKIHMPTVYMTAGMYPGLVDIEVLTPHFIIISRPYRADEDVETMRNHFRDVWQMTHFN